MKLKEYQEDSRAVDNYPHIGCNTYHPATRMLNAASRLCNTILNADDNEIITASTIGIVEETSAEIIQWASSLCSEFGANLYESYLATSEIHENDRRMYRESAPLKNALIVAADVGNLLHIVTRVMTVRPSEGMLLCLPRIFYGLGIICKHYDVDLELALARNLHNRLQQEGNKQ